MNRTRLAVLGFLAIAGSVSGCAIAASPVVHEMRGCSTIAKEPHADLSYCDLSGANLVGADLNHANLHYANLANANLTNANLQDANLRRASLIDANLEDANLRWARLYGATWTDGRPCLAPSIGKCTTWFIR